MGGLPDFLPGECRGFSCDSPTWYVEVLTPGSLNVTFFGNGLSQMELVKMRSQRRRGPLTEHDCLFRRRQRLTGRMPCGERESDLE